MSLKDRINADIITAMKAQNKADLRGMRAIKGAIQLAETDGSGQAIDESREISILQKLVKSRRDSLDIYEKQGREDLAVTEREEIEVIERYLPQPLGDEELTRFVATTIQQLGATSMKDMGDVVKAMQLKVAGRADGKAISTEVRRQLGA